MIPEPGGQRLPEKRQWHGPGTAAILARHMRTFLLLLLFATFAAPAFAEFDMPQPARRSANLFDYDPASIERQGGGKGWPYGGLTFGAYTGVFPLFVAFTQGFELAVPIVPVLSATARVEATAGVVLNGYFIEPGLRLRMPLSEIMTLNFDAAIHLGAGRYDVGLFDEPEDIGQATGWGPVTRAGFDIGGRDIRFFMSLAGSFFFFRTEDERRISTPYLGLEFGIRFYL